jgi:hypothetical protein
MNTRGSRLTLIPYITVALLGTCAAFAQAPTADGVPVKMVVTVEPRHGSDVPSVTRADVMVYEGKNRDRVTDWVPAQMDRAGLDLYILIDDSSSPALSTQISDIRKFITGQPSTAKIGLAYMQNGSARIVESLTSDHDLAAKALRMPVGAPGISASPYIALSDLVKRWPESANRRAVLMITDGIDFEYGSGDMLDPYLSAAIQESQRAGVIVSAIYAPGSGHLGHSYWLSHWGQMYLAELAEETGGEAYYIGFTGAAPDFTPFLKDMDHRLSHQYLLTFIAKPEKKSGMRSVKVRTELPNVDLVSPNSVYVPASE